MSITPKEVFEKANSLRHGKGLPVFVWDDHLAKSADLHAHDLAEGRVKPHDRLQQRLVSAGFPVSDHCKITRSSMQANYTEGIVDSPAEISLDNCLEALLSGGPQEAHYQDFYDPKITHVGIGVAYGVAGGHLVLDYGLLCEAPPAPAPSPKPSPAPVPAEAVDFSNFNSNNVKRI